jgi:SAM-dependent methyltransferase
VDFEALEVARDVHLTAEDVHAIIAKPPAPSHLTFHGFLAHLHYGNLGLTPQNFEWVNNNGLGYEDKYAFHTNDIASFARFVNIQPNESVLDLGTGLGWILYELRKIQATKPGFQPQNRPRFVGIDACMSLINAVTVRERREPNNSIYKGFEFWCDDMWILEHVQGGPFDVITGCWVLQHLLTSHRQPAFNRWKQLLAPRGRIVMDFQGNVPTACATDIRYSKTAHPLRTFLLLQEEINRMGQEYVQLVAGTNTDFVFDRGIGFRILGISNRARALGRNADYNGVGHLDDSAILDQMITDFKRIAGRQPTHSQIQHLKSHYIQKLLGRVQQVVEDPGAVRCDVKNLALVGVMRLA